MRISTNKFTKRSLSKPANAGWSGNNITSNALGFDDLYSGQAYGDLEFGGFEHFKARTEVQVSH